MTEEAGRETALSNQNSPRVRHVLKFLKGGRRILDIGCNTGWFLDLVDAEEKIGLDIDNSFREQVEEKGHIFINGYSWNIDVTFPENSFDRVHCGQVIAHMRPDLVEMTLKGVRKILTPDGIFVLTTVVGPSFIAGMYWIENNQILYQRPSWFHVYEWEPTELLLLFKDIGFKVQGITILPQEDPESDTYKSHRFVQIIVATKGEKKDD
jgi:SAM-dependent methyltransferase